MTSTGRAILIVLAITSMVALAGCTEALDDSDSEEDISGEELQANAIEAMEDVETVSFELEQSTNVMGSDQTVTINGTMNTASERMQMQMQLGSMLFDTSMEAYMVNDTMYMNLFEQWLQTNVSDSNVWTYNQDQVEQQKRILNASTPEIKETTEFQGNEVYVVEIDMDDVDINEIINGNQSSMNSSGGFGFGGEGETNESDADFDIGQELRNQTEITSGSVVQYIDTESYHVRQTRMNMTAETALGEIDYSLRITFDDFNEPTSIELPAGAENAIDIEEFLDSYDFGDEFDFGGEDGGFDFGSEDDDETAEDGDSDQDGSQDDA